MEKKRNEDHTEDPTEDHKPKKRCPEPVAVKEEPVAAKEEPVAANGVRDGTGLAATPNLCTLLKAVHELEVVLNEDKDGAREDQELLRLAHAFEITGVEKKRQGFDVTYYYDGRELGLDAFL